MALVQAETENELLLVAGQGTTVNLIGNGTLALWEHPDQRQRRYDHPELLACAVEEVLRCHRPVEKFGPRIALEEVEFSGQRIPKGSDILIVLSSPTEGPWFGSLSIKDAHMWSCTFCANVSDGNASVMPSS